SSPRVGSFFSCIERASCEKSSFADADLGGAVDVPVVPLRVTGELASDPIGEHANSRSDGVADAAEHLEALGLRPAGGGRIRQLPAKLQATAWRDGAARVADCDDDVPALADIIDGLTRLVGDVDAELTHDRDRKRMDRRRLRTCALDVKAVSGER